MRRADIDRWAKRELAEIERRRQLYLQGRARVALEGRTLILVDDGIATGASVRAALTALRRRRPKALVLACRSRRLTSSRRSAPRSIS